MRFAAFAFALSACLLAPAAAEVPDKAAPFTGVRWEGEQPVVRVDGEWLALDEIDGIPVARIVAFAQEEHGRRWQKRFAEDLVELLRDMGHAPSATARLSLRRDGESFVRDAAMTKENRQAAWKYNQGDDDTPARPPGKPAADGRVDTLPSAEHAALLGRHIDAIWDQAPRSGTAKVRVLFQQDGRPFAGKVSVHGEFLFRARGRIAYHQGLNPNANGRWLHDELAPDTYDLEIEGTGRFDGFTWTRESIALGAGDVVTYTIDLDPGAPGD